MTQIDFHTGVPDRLAHACRVARKALRSGRHLVVRAPQALLQDMDRMLWHMAPHDFVAHCRADAAAQMLEVSPIVLALPGQEVARHEVLLNLDDEIPPDFAVYGQVVEVVSAHDQADLHHARQRWKRYRELGHSPVRHDLQQEPG